jgi:hypothetical protein
MRSTRWTTLVLMVLLLAMCGCGGGSKPTPTPPLALTYSTPAAVYQVGTSIPPNNPTSTGGVVSSYSVKPSLPTGLTLSISTGVISGTPTQATSAANYVVTASNAAGSANVMLSITVNAAAPTSLTYSTNPAVYNVGLPIAANTPTSTGAVATSYTVIPTLPWGLSLNSTTGAISGIPTVPTVQTNYTVTAYSSSGGSTSATLTLTVANGAPSSLTYSSSTPTYTVNQAIPANIPSNSGGQPTSYSGPTLPSWLTLNTTTGVITGTPPAAAAASQYTITAANAFGHTTTNLIITVESESATTLTYVPSTVVYTAGQTITPLQLSNAVIGSYSVNPPLPAGLSLDSGSGTISGTPSNIS